ncbi:SurA N-terminal domain-containing protein [Granulicella paludicola]|uniref:SurA N-terminal domain-containing protein n=1 Tax=Granulicella paludicola TaxID=474951 RepID=UPI0021DF6389|nr:SurA N-terminal domain-containing protein [Granulicella paludicola]
MSRIFPTRLQALTLSPALALLFLLPCGAQTSAAPKKPVVITPARSVADSSNGSNQFDRSVAVVNGDLILDSDVDKELRFQELNFDPNADKEASHTVASSRDAAIERLINRQLILQQIQLQDQPPIADDELDKQIGLLRQTIPACSQHQCDSDTNWNQYLNTQGFTAASFRDQWRLRLQVLSFIEARFRSGVRVDDKTVADYYEKTMLPRYKAAKAQAPPLEKVQDRIAQVLIEQEVSKLLNDWLQTLRAQGGVVIFHPGQPAP